MQITEKVKKVLEGENISLEELQMMVHQASLTSTVGGNRRYCHWLFLVDDDHEFLIDMRQVDLVEQGHGRDRVRVRHDSCSGEGCHNCGWVGDVIQRITDTSSRMVKSRRKIENVVS